MKKQISVILAIALIFTSFTALLTLTSCDSDLSKKPYDVTFLRPSFNMTGDEDPLTQTLLGYEKQYDAKVTPIISSWGDWQTKVMTMAAAGKAIDVIFTAPSCAIVQARNDLIQPLDDYVDKNAEGFQKEVAEQCYTFRGSTWGSPDETLMWCIYYNKDLVAAAGLEDPYDLYKAGEWNFDSFTEYIEKLTVKNEQDEIKQYGIGTWWYKGLWQANLGEFAKIDNMGKLTSGLNDQSLINGLQYAHDSWATGNWAPDNAENNFLNGTQGMYIERNFWDNALCYWKIDGKTSINHGVVPFPYGPDNTEKLNIAEGNGYAIGNQCRNPVGAGKLIEYIAANLNKKIEEIAPVKNSEHAVELFAEMKQNIYFPQIAESAMNDACWAGVEQVLAEMWAGDSIKSSLDSIKTIMEKGLEDSNKSYEKPILLELEEKLYDFEDGAADLFTVIEGQTLNSTIVEGADALDGEKSLLIEPNSAITDSSIIAKIDTSKFAPVPWRYIQVDLDYKPYDPEDVKGFYCILMVDKDMNIVGRTDLDWFYPEKTTEKKHATMTVCPPASNENTELYLVLRVGENPTPIIIDNVRFSEQK